MPFTELFTQAITPTIKDVVDNKGDKQSSPLSQGGKINIGGFTVQPYEPQSVTYAKYGALAFLAFIVIKKMGK